MRDREELEEIGRIKNIVSSSSSGVYGDPIRAGYQKLAFEIDLNAHRLVSEQERG